MQSNICKFLGTIGWLALVAGCGSSSSTGSSAEEAAATRDMTGSVEASAPAGLVNRTASEDCVADTVIATDSTGETAVSEIEDDCSFTLTLNVGTSYVISFSLEGTFVATMIFDANLVGDTTSILPVSDGEGAIDLGTITIEGEVASPESEPLDQCDSDDDGESDLEDSDDDGDDVDDEEESDCDEDDFDDDTDEDDSDCDEDDSEGDEDEDDDEDEDEDEDEDDDEDEDEDEDDDGDEDDEEDESDE